MRIFRQPDCAPGLLIGLALLLLILPLRWILALLVAAAFHELCHLLALRLCGGQCRRIRLGAFGAVIQAAPLTPLKALFCSLAGPAGGLALIGLARWFPRLALCGAMQSAFNLLPIRGLDGSHALRFFLELFLPPTAVDLVCRITEQILLFLACLSALYCTAILKLGIVPLLTAGSLVVRATAGKIPCKS